MTVRHVAAALVISRLAAAQTGRVIPVVELPNPSARTSVSLGAVLGVRQLAGGRLLVNDAGRRRVLLFDSTLTRASVVIDSASGTQNSYGPRASTLIAYLGDSTLFVDIVSQSLVVIDPGGRIGRVMAAPRPQEVGLLSQGSSGVDARGRLVYRGVRRTAAPASAASPGATVWSSDSAPIVRADFQTRVVDTVARVKIPVTSPTRVVEGANGKMVGKTVVNLLQAVDDWALLADGTIALVRGHDYHIDWVSADGAHTSSAKLPFEWKRVTDDDKQRMIDSARAAEAARTRAADSAKSAGANAADVARTAAQPGRVSLILPGGQPVLPETEYLPLNEMPDYYPPIRAGAVRADLDGNLWILPTTTTSSRAGELVYDVVNRRGDLFERVRIPAGRTIAGFGRGGVVYLLAGDRASGYAVERTRVPR
jgi:hypothetical protein